MINEDNFAKFKKIIDRIQRLGQIAWENTSESSDLDEIDILMSQVLDLIEGKEMTPGPTLH